MAYALPEGSKFLFSNTFAATKTITALSNANPALATSAAHGYVDGDEVVLSSGWEDASDSIYRVDQQDTGTFLLLGLDSTNTSYFSAGSGTGTTSLVSSWLEIPQVLGVQTSGGDPKFTSVSPLARRNSFNIPTGFNASSITLTLGHDPTNANFQTMLGISRTLSKVGFKMLLSGGFTAYGYGYMSVSEVPQLNSGQVNQVTCVLTISGRTISYAS